MVVSFVPVFHRLVHASKWTNINVILQAIVRRTICLKCGHIHREHLILGVVFPNLRAEILTPIAIQTRNPIQHQLLILKILSDVLTESRSLNVLQIRIALEVLANF